MVFALLGLIGLAAFDVGLVWVVAKLLLPAQVPKSIANCLMAAICIFVVSAIVYGILSKPPFKFPVLATGQSIGAFWIFTVWSFHDSRRDKASMYLSIPWLAIIVYSSLKMLIWCILEPSITRF